MWYRHTVELIQQRVWGKGRGEGKGRERGRESALLVLSIIRNHLSVHSPVSHQMNWQLWHPAPTMAPGQPLLVLEVHSVHIRT